MTDKNSPFIDSLEELVRDFLRLRSEFVFFSPTVLDRHPERRPLRPESKDPEASMHGIAVPPEGSRRLLIAGLRARITRRIAEHREKAVASFTTRYNVTRLVYFERYDRATDAIDVPGSAIVMRCMIVPGSFDSGRNGLRSG
ncbi:MAG: hypothetical protein WAM05_05725 [Candidatus Binataceae bacterium]